MAIVSMALAGVTRVKWGADEAAKRRQSQGRECEGNASRVRDGQTGEGRVTDERRVNGAS